MRLATIATACVLLAGCASFSADGGFGQVSALTKERIGQPVAAQKTNADVERVRGRVDELLKAPLTPESAVEVALLNNRGLQAKFADLGIAEAERVRAGRLKNPSFSFGRLSGGGDVEIDRAVLFDVLGLLTLPLAGEVGQRRFEQAQVQAAADAVSLAADVRRAYFDAVAAQESARYHEQVKEAADASGELARRMLQAGNFSKLAQMREQAFQADATAQLARTRHQASAQRERLVRLLGLSGAQLDFRLPERLPDLPKQPTEPRDAERTAMEQRLDVLMARRSAEATARNLGLTKATRFVNVLEAGYQNRSETGKPRSDGYEIQHGHGHGQRRWRRLRLRAEPSGSAPGPTGPGRTSAAEAGRELLGHGRRHSVLIRRLSSFSKNPLPRQGQWVFYCPDTGSGLVAGSPVRLVIAAFQGVAAFQQIACRGIDREARDVDPCARFAVVDEPEPDRSRAIVQLASPRAIESVKGRIGRRRIRPDAIGAVQRGQVEVLTGRQIHLEVIRTGNRLALTLAVQLVTEGDAVGRTLANDGTAAGHATGLGGRRRREGRYRDAGKGQGGQGAGMLAARARDMH